MDYMSNGVSSMVNDEYIITTEGLCKFFGALKAVDHVSIRIPKRKISILIGPNGSGKTTLVNTICGVYKPDDGRVFYNGIDITGKPPHELYKMGIVRTFQVPSIWPRLTVLENLLTSIKNPGEGWIRSLFKRSWRKYEEEAVEKAYRILEFLGIDELWDRRAGELSGGQLRLVEVGRALMVDAKVMIMDEPLASLNPVIAGEICKLMQRLRDQMNITFLIIEHRLDIALEYVDYAFAMHRGRIIAEGKPEKVVLSKEVIESYLGG